MLEAARQIVDAAERITCFSGAGLSAPSGVGTFRDPVGGWWTKHDPMRLASPQGFAEDPDLVMDWYAARRSQIGSADPNPAHRILATREDIVQVTQNTDDLLVRAGCDSVIQVHGDIGADRCHGECGHIERIDLTDPPGRRPCPCGRAELRPDVIWFGEALDPDVWQRAEAACSNCDVLLVVGTDASVYPAAGLITLARRHGARIVVVNMNPSRASGIADVELIGSAAELLPALLA